MTRSDLIEAISARFPQLHQKDAGLGVALILGAIADNLVRGERAEIRGFGSFNLNYRKPRIGRNPQTGDRVDVPAKWSPHFKAGKELRERVDVGAADYL
jgi:integration host factor subunit beta